jgi:hypothetical protein
MGATCINCRGTLADADDRCPTCGVQASEPPNVRAVGTAEEKEALEQRYSEAFKEAKKDNSLDALKRLESELKKSLAVVGTDIHILRQLVTNDKALYSNYVFLVNANVRKSASFDDDRRRRVADAMLLDGYADKIVFAALSLDGIGLKSYGAYSVTLREVAIERRSTVLEENSFSFVEKRCSVTGPIPKGYRAIWQERHKLGVAKLAERIKKNKDPNKFPALVLHNGSDRHLDDFLEVQIYGPFDGNAIESVRGPSNPKKRDEKAMVRVVKEFLASAGKVWIDA